MHIVETEFGHIAIFLNAGEVRRIQADLNYLNSDRIDETTKHLRDRLNKMTDKGFRVDKG